VPAPLTIVCPVYHEQDNIERLLDEVRAKIRTPHTTLVVYDKDDPDPTALRLACAWARWVVQREARPSAAVADFVQNRASPRPGITVRPVRIDRRNRIGLVILSVDEGSPAAQVSLLIGDLLTGTDNAPFTMTADLADAIAEPGLHLKLRFLRGDRTREREVVFSLGRRFASEAA